ncbi:hypothetical protein CesoFtcFv8_007493 [Champsocephalus esox]|uniref:Uncharacterized protein n=1 Tax=Champsocephalus esox TaxID=159716 RepID=A0AAN8H4K4_9TELE|nr:hypothetical protein CesoFtcFv8_007493 [Champsocephalus esox]
MGHQGEGLLKTQKPYGAAISDRKQQRNVVCLNCSHEDRQPTVKNRCKFIISSASKTSYNIRVGLAD